jgi:hypothetical protein
MLGFNVEGFPFKPDCPPPYAPRGTQHIIYRATRLTHPATTTGLSAPQDDEVTRKRLVAAFRRLRFAMDINLMHEVKMTLVDAHKWPMVLCALDKVLRSECEGIATPEAVQRILQRRYSDLPPASIEVVTEEDYRRSVGEEVYALEEYSNPSQYKSAREFEAQAVRMPSCPLDTYRPGNNYRSVPAPQFPKVPTKCGSLVRDHGPSAPPPTDCPYTRDLKLWKPWNMESDAEEPPA